jgi:hypothetical protein
MLSWSFFVKLNVFFWITHPLCCYCKWMFYIFRNSVTIRHCRRRHHHHHHHHHHPHPMTLKLSDSSVGRTSRARSSAMLVLPTLENWKLRIFGRPPQWHNFHIKFYPNPSSGFCVNSCGQTDTASHISFIPFTIFQTTNQKLTKVGVLHKRRTSSLARLKHSCVRNA